MKMNKKLIITIGALLVVGAILIGTGLIPLMLVEETFIDTLDATTVDWEDIGEGQCMAQKIYIRRDSNIEQVSYFEIRGLEQLGDVDVKIGLSKTKTNDEDSWYANTDDQKWAKVMSNEFSFKISTYNRLDSWDVSLGSSYYIMVKIYGSTSNHLRFDTCSDSSYYSTTCSAHKLDGTTWINQNQDLKMEVKGMVSYNYYVNTPTKPTCSSNSGNVASTYTFKTKTSTNGDDLEYLWDFDDETTQGWRGPYDSGEEISQTHAWTQAGDFDVRVKARIGGTQESSWSPVLVFSVSGGTDDDDDTTDDDDDTGDDDDDEVTCYRCEAGLLVGEEFLPGTICGQGPAVGWLVDPPNCGNVGLYDITIIAKYDNGNPADGVKISLECEDLNYEDSETTDSSGIVTFSDLSPGTYIATGEISGFNADSIEIVLTDANVPKDMIFSMPGFEIVLLFVAMVIVGLVARKKVKK